MTEDQQASIIAAMERYGRMQRINRIGKLTAICMAALLLIAIVYGLFG